MCGARSGDRLSANLNLTQLGETEVENLNRVSTSAIRFEPDVIRLQIAMNDSRVDGLRPRPSRSAR